jgi:hypothetical protein
VEFQDFKQIAQLSTIHVPFSGGFTIITLRAMMLPRDSYEL